MRNIVLVLNARVVVEVDDGVTPEQAYKDLDFNVWPTTDRVDVLEADLDGFSEELEGEE